VTAHSQIVDRIIEQTPNDARYFAGFVGWQPGELAAELEAGWWLVSDPDAALVFGKDTGDMWEGLLKRFGARPAPPKGMECSASSQSIMWWTGAFSIAHSPVFRS
jgi:putative AlgH/UPF0301 family transcriptional regulator